MSHEANHDAAHANSSRSAGSRWIIAALATVLVGYAGSAFLGYPQRGRDLIVQGQSDHHQGHHGQQGHHEHGQPHEDGATAPPIWTVLPFVLLLAAIAIFPLVPSIEHWWEHNENRLLVACLLGAVTLAYYAFLHRHPVDLHFPAHAVTPAAASGISWGLVGTVLANALLAEYVPFIVLLFALYCVTGGVRIEGDLEATPTTNAAFLTVGGLLASFIGTTGAAMLLIRPLLETNRERRRVAHTVVFFIFVVCNCGGCLLPIGDPPRFLGYLQGVDFFWTLSLWKPWIFTNAVLVAIYWAWDTFLAHPQETPRDLARDHTQTRRLTISGLLPNAPLLLAVIAAVALLDPSKPLPGTEWHPWVFLREAVLLGIVLVSLAGGSAEIRRKNAFSYGAIVEVAALFLGIFVCMQPALAILDERGASLGIESARAFFWTTGALSSVLDNAPTYLVFFKTAQALGAPAADPATTMAGVDVMRLAGVSLGAVFLGAMTYIGNGPNFMVKAIAEKSGVRMPSFFGYMAYSFGVLLPVFVAVSLLFL